jgi:hypothetical protein
MLAACRRHLIDFFLAAMGVWTGLASLTYPFGRDQALYDYVARAWVLRGAIPYKDVFDHKTPGLYILYASAVRLFGPTTWGIRVIDILGVVLTGVLAAAVALPRKERIPPGLMGFAVLCASILFFGCLNYWDTAQSEIHYAMLGLGSVWAVRRMQHERRAQIVAGAFAGAAMVMKPTSMWFVLVAMGVLVQRVRELHDARVARTARGFGAFAGGAALVIVPVATYFAAHGALGSLYDIAFKANAYYASHETNVQSATTIPLRIWEYLAYYNPISTVGIGAFVAAIWVARVKKDHTLLERHLLAGALCLAGFLAVLMQLKFYLLHWSAIIAPATVVFVNLVLDVQLVGSHVGVRRAIPVSAIVLVLLYVMAEQRVRAFYDENATALARVTGRIDEREYARHFDFPGFFSYTDSTIVAAWIRERTTPDDFIAVRGFEPQIYLLSDRRYPGRFFWTTFFANAMRESPSRRAVWAKEDLDALARHPPKFVVALTSRAEGPDSVSYFTKLGYDVRLVVDDFTVLERER